MKNLIKIMICFSFIYTPFFAYAGAAEKWEVLENVYDKSKNSVQVTAKKITTQASNDGTYRVRVPVNASDLGKTVKGMLWIGVATSAVTGLVNAVGWVIDEGSKVIKKPIEPDVPNVPLLYKNTSGQANLWHSDPDSACKEFNVSSSYNYRYISHRASDKACLYQTQPKSPKDSPWSATKYQFGYITKPNPDYVPNKEPEFVPVSDDELGTLILGDSTEPGAPSVPQPDIITDAYSPSNPVPNAPAPQAVIDALADANPESDPDNPPQGSTDPKPNEDVDGDGKPDVYNPELPQTGSNFELPAFCSWAPAVCDFFKVQKQDNKEIKENQKQDIEQNKTFFDEVNDFFDWTKEDNDLPKNEDAEISQIPLPELKEDAVIWSAQCPNDAQIPINLYGQSTTLTLSWSPWCQLLSIIKPAIIASAYIGGAFIVLGLRT